MVGKKSEWSHDDMDEVWNLNTWIEQRGGRAVRFAGEYLGPQQRFVEEGVDDFVVFFGSARTDEQEPVYLAAREISERITTWAIDDSEKGGARMDGSQRFHVCSGGGPGIMRAANEGARRAGGRSVALGIKLPFEQGFNEYADTELSIEFQYFAMRKFWFVYPAKFIIAFPGGFGTLDEVFEVLTLIQTKKIDRPLPIILFDSKFWSRFADFGVLIERGTISETDLDLFTITDSIDEVVRRVTQHLSQIPEVEHRAP